MLIWSDSFEFLDLNTEYHEKFNVDLLAPQSGALSRLAYREFQPIPPLIALIQSEWSFIWARSRSAVLFSIVDGLVVGWRGWQIWCNTRDRYNYKSLIQLCKTTSQAPKPILGSLEILHLPGSLNTCCLLPSPQGSCTVGLAEISQNCPKSQKRSRSAVFLCKNEF